jgi:hypothetical protein
VQWGIIDPAKVVCAALENAISVAGMILSTDALNRRAARAEAERRSAGTGKWRIKQGRCLASRDGSSPQILPKPRTTAADRASGSRVAETECEV